MENKNQHHGTLQQSGRTSSASAWPKPQNDFSLVKTALKRLQARSLVTLNDDEMDVWLEDLSKVPPWKLKKVDEHTGHMRDIWKFFDTLQAAPQSATYNKNQIANHSDPEKGRVFMKITTMLLMMKLPREQFEQAQYWLLKEKFPDWPGES